MLSASPAPASTSAPTRRACPLTHVVRIAPWCARSGSGTLEFPEFCQLAAQFDMGEQTPEELHDAFVLLSHGSSSIEAGELHMALTTFGSKPLSEDEYKEFMAEADVNRNGTIEEDEYIRAMTWAYEKR